MMLFNIHRFFLGALYFGSMVSMVVNVFFALKKIVVAVDTGRREGIEANPLQGIAKSLGQVVLAAAGMYLSIVGCLNIMEDHFTGKWSDYHCVQCGY